MVCLTSAPVCLWLAHGPPWPIRPRARRETKQPTLAHPPIAPGTERVVRLGSARSPCYPGAVSRAGLERAGGLSHVTPRRALLRGR